MKRMILLFCLFAESIVSMEDLGDLATQGVLSGVDQSGFGGQSVPVEEHAQHSLERFEGPREEEKEAAIAESEVDVKSLNTIPISVLMQPRGYIEGATVAVGYYGKKALNLTGNVVATVASLSPSGVVKKLGESAGEVSKSMTTEESPQFPTLSVKYLDTVFEGIQDRKLFSEKGLFERCVLFEKSSYLGAAVIMDYNVGKDRFFEPGNLTKEFYSVDDTTRVEQAIQPCEWLQSQFNMKSCSLNAMMVGSRFKDGLYNSHLLYKLGGDPIALYLDVMRKPALEFVEKIAGWINAQKAQKTELGQAFVAWIRQQTSITPERQEELCKKYDEVWAKLMEVKAN